MIRLTGRLICADKDEARRVAVALPKHLELTRGEPGCLEFTVEPTNNPLIWLVNESFAGPGAFAAHQDRTAASDWATATRGIRRDYAITEEANGT